MEPGPGYTGPVGNKPSDDQHVTDVANGGFSEEGPPEAISDEFLLDEEARESIPDSPKPRAKLTRGRAKAFSERKKNGYWFLLQHTRDEDNNPMEALVYRVNFLDKEVLGHLPRQIRNKLLNLQIERAKRQGDNRPDLTPDNLVRELSRTREMADAYCCAGFIEPKVYMTESEAELMDGVWVEDIDISDRMIFSAICEGSFEDALRLLTPFSGESEGPVGLSETESDVSGATPESDDQVADDAPLPELVLVKAGD